ncbi:MAG: hypothetical protein Q9174_000359 [Haloplaca sp. 1 TL-2023]
MPYRVSALSAIPFDQQAKVGRDVAFSADINRRAVTVAYQSTLSQRPYTPLHEKKLYPGQQEDLAHAFIAAGRAIGSHHLNQAPYHWTFTPSSQYPGLCQAGPDILRTSKRSAATAELSQTDRASKKRNLTVAESLVGNPSEESERQHKPRKKAATKPRRSLPRLSGKHPVQASVNIDIWHLIILSSPLSFVFRIKDVSKQIRDLLTHNSAIWKEVRLRTYGRDHPDPPPGLNERQYADLLVAYGCQDKHCNDDKARKVYWAFQRRWCASCLKKNVVTEAGCAIYLSKHPHLAPCMPTAAFDGWGHYTGVSQYDSNGEWLGRSSGTKQGFLRSDLANATKSLEGAEKEDLTVLQERNSEVAKQLRSIEDWTETRRRESRSQADARRQEIRDFFTAKALLMEPPLELETLEQMECFGTAVGAASKPSERAWKYVKPKLEADRKRAEALVEELNEKKREHEREHDWTSYLTPPPRPATPQRVDGVDLYDLYEAADLVLDGLIQGPESFNVADGDLVRIALTRVFQSWESQKGTLYLQHALKVYKEKIGPVIDRLKDERRRKVCKGLRCPGCKKGTKMQWPLLSLFLHIKHTHANRVGSFDGFRAISTGFPFGAYGGDREFDRIKWPANLPILAAGQDSTGRWDLDAQNMEQFSPPFEAIGASSVDADVGAFHNRVVQDRFGPLRGRFVDSVIFAASQLDDTQNTFPDNYKTRIVLEFGLQKLQAANGPRPDMKMLKELRIELLRTGLKGIFEGSRCKKCCDDAVKDGRRSLFARSVKSLGQLSEHFETEHPRYDWAQDMLVLPTDEDLATQLRLPSNSTVLELFEALFPTV